MHILVALSNVRWRCRLENFSRLSLPSPHLIPPSFLLFTTSFVCGPPLQAHNSAPVASSSASASTPRLRFCPRRRRRRTADSWTTSCSWECFGAHTHTAILATHTRTTTTHSARASESGGRGGRGGGVQLHGPPHHRPTVSGRDSERREGQNDDELAANFRLMAR